ncbi:MAG: phage tail protein [Nocardioidaceae bacterium]|nr:phage tail protein [Nocardioidaceae bacterium]
MTESNEEAEAFDPAQVPVGVTTGEGAYLGEIRAFPFKFTPAGWAACNGQLLSISAYTALFSVIGTTYGGNGSTNFALPNLQGRAPMMWGTSGGGPYHSIGEYGGTPSVTLRPAEMAQHTHSVNTSIELANQRQPLGYLFAQGDGVNAFDPVDAASTAALFVNTITYVGQGAPHNNMMPFLTLRFCICMEGDFPNEV